MAIQKISGDYYIANPSALCGQPKRMIAEYVEQKGILVPRRFESLEKARLSEGEVLARSEHVHEYHVLGYGGVSGDC